MKIKKMKIILVGCMLLGITACGSYYRVKDPGTQKIYYTDEIEDQKGGAVRFKDANTGTIVTIQNSEVSEIPKDEYKSTVMKK